MPADHSLGSCLFHEPHVDKNSWFAFPDQKAPLIKKKQKKKRANRPSSRLKQSCFTMKSAGKEKKKRKNTAGHGSSLGMKMIFERWDIIFTREKHGEIAHSLERVGLPLRDAGERDRDRGGERKRGSRGGSGQELSMRGSVKRDLLKSW